MFSGAFGAEEREDMSVLGRLGKGDVGKDGGSCDGGGGVGIVHWKVETDARFRTRSTCRVALNPNLICACVSEASEAKN